MRARSEPRRCILHASTGRWYVVDLGGYIRHVLSEVRLFIHRAEVAWWLVLFSLGAKRGGVPSWPSRPVISGSRGKECAYPPILSYELPSVCTSLPLRGQVRYLTVAMRLLDVRYLASSHHGGTVASSLSVARVVSKPPASPTASPEFGDAPPCSRTRPSACIRSQPANIACSSSRDSSRRRCKRCANSGICKDLPVCLNDSSP